MTSARYRCSSLLMAKDQFTSYIPTSRYDTTHMNQKYRPVPERTRGKQQSYFKGVFMEATIPGRDNQDSDLAAESDNNNNADDR